jgi:signal transduction histidine kinase
MSRFRWLLVVLPAFIVGGIELLSDTVLDEALPFPFDTLIVVAAIAAISILLGVLAFRRIDALAATVAARNRELEGRAASARALHHVSVAIAGLVDLRQILDAVVRNAAELLETDVALLLLAGADGRLTYATASGAVERVRQAGDLVGEDPADEVLRFLPLDLAVTRLAAPLQRGGETIGLLAVAAGTSRSFDVDALETLASLANQAAIAIENARLQSRLRELAVVTERERIAREMHDGLAQVLGYVNTKSQAVEEFLAAGRVTEARGQLSELAGAARSIYVDVREAILGLRSPIRPELGLVGAIELYARSFAEASKLAVSVEAAADVRTGSLAPEVEAQVFRIVQESLTNVRKHAAARRVEIRLRIAGDDLVVEMADDGTGIRPGPAIDGWPHYGLEAMRERAAAIGGQIEWSTGAAGGGLVSLSIPRAAAAEGATVA